jgi:energy-converting hydrogenase Eha subunit F
VKQGSASVMPKPLLREQGVETERPPDLKSIYPEFDATAFKLVTLHQPITGILRQPAEFLPHHLLIWTS